MKIRDLAHLLLQAPDLNREVKVYYRGDFGCDITGISLDGNNNLGIRASGYDVDAIKVKTEIEVKSPHKEKPDIW